MYRKYKKDCNRREYDNHTKKVIKDVSFMNGIEMEHCIQECWNTIYSSCTNELIKSFEPEISRSGWKTVRIFISSTFTDFHSEREVLVKQVFPALKEWCEPLQIRVVECDLRWGVPKGTPTSTTIITCMEELQRCNEETNGEAFFINMLGERYGWIPDMCDIHEEVKHLWVPQTSITHMEILVGAFRSKNRNAAFFFRDSSVLSDIPEEMLKRFRDEDTFSQLHLRTLRAKLHEKFPDQVFPYEASFAGIDSSTGRNLPIIGNLKEFAEKVLKFLKMAISRKYPNNLQEKEVLEEQIHGQVMESKAAFVLGREKEIQVLSDFVKGNVNKALAQLTYRDAQDNEKNFENSYKECVDIFRLLEEDNPILAVVGDSGIGKSAVLAKLASSLKQFGEKVMYHCVGSSHSSFRENNILVRIIAALSPEIPEKELDSLSTKTVADLQGKMAECVEQQRSAQTKVTLIIDGINEVPVTSNTQLAWLPPLTPGQVRCIVSCNSQDRNALLHLSRKKPYCVKLGAFDLVSKKTMVEQYLSVFRKSLDSDQLTSLISHTGSSNPLWLSMACEELRVYGDFRTLTHKIQSLPPDLSGLFQQVLDRLLMEDETRCMLKVLAFICFSMDGLPESHISSLLGDFKEKTEVAPVVWATVRRQIKPLVRMITVWHTGEPRIQYFHSTIQQAVKKTVVSRGGTQTAWHSQLATYYRDVCQDHTYTAVDLPYHLEQAEDKRGLLQFLRNDTRSFSTPHLYRVKHAMSLRCGNTVSPFKATVLHMCLFCNSATTFKLSPGAGKNSDKCVICGLWVPNQVNQVKPRLCASHSKLGPPNAVMCNVCGIPIHGPNGPPATGRLCFQCSTWRGGQNQCCQLVTC